MLILHLCNVTYVKHDALSFIEIDLVPLERYQLGSRLCFFLFSFLLLQFISVFRLFDSPYVQAQVYFVDLAEDDVAESIAGGILQANRIFKLGIDEDRLFKQVIELFQALLLNYLRKRFIMKNDLEVWLIVLVQILRRVDKAGKTWVVSHALHSSVTLIAIITFQMPFNDYYLRLFVVK